MGMRLSLIGEHELAIIFSESVLLPTSASAQPLLPLHQLEMPPMMSLTTSSSLWRRDVFPNYAYLYTAHHCPSAPPFPRPFSRLEHPRIPLIPAARSGHLFLLFPVEISLSPGAIYLNSKATDSGITLPEQTRVEE
jgi:hypothetical protein